MPIIIQRIGIFVNILAKQYNYNMKLNAKEIIKLLIQKEDLTQKALVKILTQKTGKKYTPDGFSRKINRGTISYNEVVMIADILGYDINFERRKK